MSIYRVPFISLSGLECWRASFLPVDIDISYFATLTIRQPLAQMTLTTFFGCAFTAYGPSLAIFFGSIAPNAQLVILMVSRYKNTCHFDAVLPLITPLSFFVL